jgi:hypothetical protein
MRHPSSSSGLKQGSTLVLASMLLVCVAGAAKAQPVDPNYQAQVQDYQQKQAQYQAQRDDYDAKQIAHADAQAVYAAKRADYRTQRTDYAAQKRDYERARADYDARYGPGAFDRYTRTVTTTTKTYTPAGDPDGSVTSVRKEVVEH